jgi:hypothetical protein
MIYSHCLSFAVLVLHLKILLIFLHCSQFLFLIFLFLLIFIFSSCFYFLMVSYFSYKKQNFLIKMMNFTIFMVFKTMIFSVFQLLLEESINYLLFQYVMVLPFHKILKILLLDQHLHPFFLLLL